jgi:hypothetical protein
VVVKERRRESVFSHASTGDVENHELNFSHKKIGQF